MGIRFRCPSCKHGLNVKNYLAGRRGICPKCKSSLEIPAESEQVTASVSKSKSANQQSSDSRRPAFRQTASTASSHDIQSAARSFESLEFQDKSPSPTSPQSAELQLDSKRPAPDWDDSQNGEAAKPTSLNSNTSLQSRQPITDPHPEHGNRTGSSQSVGLVEGSSSKSLNPSSDKGDDLSSPFDNLAFEDLDPNSFVLDRPENTPVDKPTGHYDWIAEAPQAVWYVRHNNGAQYGPAVGPQMRTWVSEGRVTIGCHVWREGWPNWRAAGDVFPQIKPQTQQQKPTPEPARQQATTTTTPSPIADQPVAANRRKNGWLFPALLLFLTVIGAIIGLVIYQFVSSSASDSESSQTAPSSPSEIVDPFAENNPSEDEAD